MNDLREILIKQMLGDNIIYGYANLFIDHASGGNLEGLWRHMVGGVLVTETPFLKKNNKIGSRNSARLYKGELIIVPRNVYEECRMSGGYRMDQILCGGYENYYMWNKKIMKDGKPTNLLIPQYSHELTEKDEP